ncbi:hypothetical protein GCM10011380_22770 [Sphingomonas metalli]|uniref:Uncharacterized protein n=1 Tax=Sphingomonas metalli TaxID=1779358 RepID=A0A916T6M4_9SPHN|nr:hypothetical protein [Sphingomonas metalli]GGB32779.1 hypothetical protein GCM10011380_22770 [Sphingomonas metalli]
MSETPDQATRRRWVSLAEAVAVAGLVIGALTLWLSWSDKRDERIDKASEQASAARERARVELVASVEDGGRTLTLKDERHDLSDAAISFPGALGVETQRPPGDPAIDAGWFEEPLLKATDGGADRRTGRLPVLIRLRYWDGDTERSSSGIYDIVWRTEGRLLRGRTVRMEGLRLRARGGDQAALDAAWLRVKP